MNKCIALIPILSVWFFSISPAAPGGSQVAVSVIEPKGIAQMRTAVELMGFLARQGGVVQVVLPEGVQGPLVLEEDVPLLMELMDSQLLCPVLVRGESSHWPTGQTTLGAMSRYFIFSYMRNGGVLYGLGSYALDDAQLVEVKSWCDNRRKLRRGVR